MKLSRTIAYAIHGTIQLARAPVGSVTPSSQLARDRQLPERFLVQILRSLVNHGVLLSTCGASGGYMLSRPPAQITLRDIIESFDNLLDLNLPDLDCMSEGARSLVVSTLNHASEAARAKLQKITLADLVRAETEKPRAAHHAPRPIGIKLQMDSNERQAPTHDSSAIG
jgi:Rrf2 family transcriptional regulator, cysteine metabolism repressor